MRVVILLLCTAASAIVFAGSQSEPPTPKSGAVGLAAPNLWPALTGLLFWRALADDCSWADLEHSATAQIANRHERDPVWAAFLGYQSISSRES